MKIPIVAFIEDSELLANLCKSIDMEFAIREGAEYLYIEDCGKNKGKVVDARTGEVVDDRADLFAAIQNLCVHMYPNCEFRSASHITNYEEFQQEDIYENQ